MPETSSTPPLPSSSLLKTSPDHHANRFPSSEISICAQSPELSPSGSSSPSPAPRQGLRKSLSVDSFVQFGRDSVSKAGTRSNRVNTESGLDPPRGLVFQNLGLQRDREHGVVRRSRGTSLSTTDDESYDHSLVEDLDIDRSGLLTHPDEGGRHYSLKGQEQSKSFIRGGELPLPSRTPTISSTSSISSTNGTCSVTREDAPRLQYASSMQSISLRPMVSDQGRTRSGSLGMHMGNVGRHIHINTQMSAVCIFYSNR
jgi:hypothetical protein